MGQCCDFQQPSTAGRSNRVRSVKAWRPSRHLIRAGMQQSVAKKIRGHRTDSVFERHNIIDEADGAGAARKSDEKQNPNVPDFGWGLGIIADSVTKNGEAQMSLTTAARPN
jgi:hypothetical protein